MKRYSQIFIASTAWLLGLTVAALWILHLNTIAVGFVSLLALVVLGVVRSKLGYLLIATAFLSLGMVRGQIYTQQQERWSVENLLGQKVILTGRVTGEPGWNDDRLHEFYITDIMQNDRTIPGAMKIKALVGSAQEGQVVSVEGKVGRALGRASTQIWYAKVAVINANPPYPIRLKNLLGRGLSAALPREEAGFVRGLLFGGSAAVSPETESDLRTVGLTHIIAVSGYNLTIIVAALTVFSRRRSRNAILLSVAGIGLFVLMTGAPASIMRAGVMAVIFLLVGYYRRELDPRVALAATIGVMTLWNPSYLYSDIGWQLSVLALVGVLWLAPGFRPRVIKRHKTAWEVTSTSIGAYLATAPILAYYFGSISLIAPLANVFILPVVPLIMLLGYCAALLGVFVPNAAFIMMKPVAWLVRLTLDVIAALAHIPNARESLSLSLDAVIMSFVLLTFLAVMMLRRASKVPLKKV